ncbi:hypothetical protein N431DRAFT_431777 [Stipitochalara longipes BDJ]|nr:hypothetical protein N431DRAFT_431777 [Stipitochalara longipes BDJ]
MSSANPESSRWLYNDDEDLLPASLPPVTTIMPEQKSQIRRLLTRVSKTQYANPFRQPVADLWPEYAHHYLEKIENPIDLLS